MGALAQEHGYASALSPLFQELQLRCTHALGAWGLWLLSKHLQSIMSGARLHEDPVRCSAAVCNMLPSNAVRWMGVP